MTPRKLCPTVDIDRAMPTAPATREPSRNLRSVSASVRIASDRASIRPMFTSRIHYGAPKAPGHRQFILAKQEWR